MGKRNLDKYKKKNKKNIEDEEIENEPTTEEDSANISNLQYLISKLQSTNTIDKENVTSLLSTYKFNTSNVKLKETIFNESFLRSLVLLLNDNCFQVKYKAISALINLIIYYNEYEIESFLLNQTSFIPVSVDLLNQFLILYDKHTSEHVKVLKTYHNFLDLLMLIFDLYNEETYQSVNFSSIENSLIELVVITDKSKVNEDLYNHINIVLSNIFSVRSEYANDNQYIQMYITEALLVFNGKESNDIIKSSMISGLFYLICSNYELFKQKDALIFQKVIEAIYYGLINQNIKSEVKALNDMVNGLTKLQDNNVIGMGMSDNDNCKNNKISHSSPESMIKAKMKTVEYKTKSVCVLIAAFSDIIENLEIPNASSSNEISNNDNLYEEIDDDDNEEGNDNDIIKDEDNSNNNTPSSFLKLISNALTDLFSKDNYSSLQKMLNQNFITNLLNLYCSEYISDYFINDIDKMLTIKDIITEIEYCSFSLINNLIEKVPTLLDSSPIFLIGFFNLCVSRLKLSEENKNEDSLSITVLSLRNMFNKYKHINTIISLASIDYSRIFLLINSTSLEAFTKMNLIDIIAYSFSFSGISLEDNMKVCNELKALFFKENNIEVLSHVINAYMDIYKEDDIDINKNLKSSEVIALMKNGVNEFRDKIKQAKINEEIDKDGYEYAKETLINMKRFVEYKEASFNQLNI